MMLTFKYLASDQKLGVLLFSSPSHTSVFTLILFLSLRFVLGVGQGAGLILQNFGVGPAFGPWVHSFLPIFVPLLADRAAALPMRAPVHISVFQVSEGFGNPLSSGLTLRHLRVSCNLCQMPCGGTSLS